MADKSCLPWIESFNASLKLSCVYKWCQKWDKRTYFVYILPGTDLELYDIYSNLPKRTRNYTNFCKSPKFQKVCLTQIVKLYSPKQLEKIWHMNSTPQDDDIRHVRVTDQLDNSDSEAGGDRRSKSPSPTPRQRMNYLGFPINTNRYSNSPVRPRHVAESNTVSMKPDIYTGDGDWEVFETQFEVCAKLGNWNQRTKAFVLAGSLRGKALEFYIHLTPEIQERYDLLVTRLEQRFSGSNQRSKWLSLLEARSRIQGESASQFADDVQRMIRKAYPHLDPTAQELMTLHTIYRGLSQDLKYNCIVENCKTVAHAVEIIETYEGIFGTGPDRKMVRMAKRTRQ